LATDHDNQPKNRGFFGPIARAHRDHVVRYVIAAAPFGVLLFSEGVLERCDLNFLCGVTAICLAALRPRPSFQSPKHQCHQGPGGNQAEGAIAVDPSNPLRQFMFANPSSGRGPERGGQHQRWHNLGTAPYGHGSDGLAAACCDPSCAFDNFGNLFVCYINSAVNAVIVGLSTNGRRLVLPDRLFLRIDRPTHADRWRNTVWVTYNLGGNDQRSKARPSRASVSSAHLPQRRPLGAGNFGDIAIGPLER